MDCAFAFSPCAACGQSSSRLRRSVPVLVVAVLAIAALAAMPPRVNAALIYGITFDNNLFSFDSSAPTNILSGVYVSGLQPNEFIQAIDFRPSTNVLYALGSTNRIYTLNLTSGAATAVGAPFAPVLSGTAFGMDFDPVTELIRVHSDIQQNLRINPVTGAVANADPSLFYVAGDPGAGQDPSIIATAYTNNTAGAQTTTLFSLDSVRDVLVRHQAAPGLAQMLTVAGLTNAAGGAAINLGNYTGFDIDPAGVAHIAWNNANSLYGTLNLSNGQVSNIASIGGGLFVRDIAAVIPEPATLAAAGLAVIGLAARRRGGQ